MKYEDESMSTFQKTMKNVMEKSNEIPQFNMSIDISMKEILKTKNEFNKRYKDTKITITPLLVKIVAELLKKYRLLNTKIINDDKIRYFKNINIGVAFEKIFYK